MPKFVDVCGRGSDTNFSLRYTVRYFRSRMAHESEHVSSWQSLSGQCGPTSASYASPDQSNSLHWRSTSALTNQIHNIDNYK